MAALSFDDLIPAGPVAGTLSFDDLIPTSTPAASGPQIPVFDAMGGVTGHQEAAPAPNRMPYGEQMGQVGQRLDDTARVIADQATLGAVNKFAAGMDTVTGRVPDYDAALKAERGRTAAIDAANPGMAGAGRMVGAMGAMGAMSAAGLPVFGGTGGLAARTARAGGSMFGYGAAGGSIAADGDVLQRAKAGGLDGAREAAIGASGPLVGAGLYGLGRLAAMPFAGRVAPQAAATGQVSRALDRSGQSVEDVTRSLGQASAEGQPMFTVADALGNPGQRLLTTVTKAPGAGRTEAVEFLEARQAGQGRRLSNFIDDGFGTAGETAEQATARLTRARDTAADTNYAAARRDAGAVDVSRALARIDETLAPGISGQANPGSSLRDDTIEGARRRVRGMLARNGEQLTGFEAVHRVRQEVQDMVERAGAQTNRGRLLGQVERELGAAMAETSGPQAAADAAYAGGSREIEAVARGKQAATRGRTEDTIPGFQALSEAEQAAFRPGYVDKYIAEVQGPASGANKARPLTSDAVRAEFPAFAAEGRADPLMRQIGRENTMYATRTVGTGGSATAENLADAAENIPISTLVNVLRGNFGSAAGDALGAAGRLLTGSMEAKRLALSRALRETDGEAFASTLAGSREAERRRKLMAQILARGVVSTAVGAQ